MPALDIRGTCCLPNQKKSWMEAEKHRFSKTFKAKIKLQNAQIKECKIVK
jgi:hypothetical protein